MKFLITGGAGFIGGHLVYSLLEMGHHVTVFDNLSSGHMNNLSNSKNYEGFKFIHGDLCETSSM